MTTNTVAVDVTTKFIDLPAGVVPSDYFCGIYNSADSIVASWAGTSLNITPLYVGTLPSGNYTVKVFRRSSQGQPIGTPATAPLVLDQTIEVPDTITLTLS